MDSLIAEIVAAPTDGDAAKIELCSIVVKGIIERMMSAFDDVRLFPGDMPDALWEMLSAPAVKGDRAGFQEMLRTVSMVAVSEVQKEALNRVDAYLEQALSAVIVAETGGEQ